MLLGRRPTVRPSQPRLNRRETILTMLLKKMDQVWRLPRKVRLFQLKEETPLSLKVKPIRWRVSRAVHRAAPRFQCRKVNKVKTVEQQTAVTRLRFQVVQVILTCPRTARVNLPPVKL